MPRDDPPGRIHALRLTQPLIWRIFDWYRVNITQAIAMVVPSLGVNDPDAFLESLCAGGGATAR